MFLKDYIEFTSEAFEVGILFESFSNCSVSLIELFRFSLCVSQVSYSFKNNFAFHLNFQVYWHWVFNIYWLLALSVLLFNVYFLISFFCISLVLFLLHKLPDSLIRSLGFQPFFSKTKCWLARGATGTLTHVGLGL